MARTNKNFEGRKGELVKLALDLFLDKGYESTTITDLQKQFQLTKGGMYHYFASKEDILDEVINYGLSEGLLEIESQMNKLPLEDRVIYLFFHGANNGFTQKLYECSKQNNNSIVGYMLRDKNIEILIPVLQNLIVQYVEAGIYHCEYPEEMAEFCAILGKAVSEKGILPDANMESRKRRVDALICLWESLMHPEAKHLEDIRMNLYKVIELQEGLRGD